MLLSLYPFFYFMPVEKLFCDENYEKSIDCFLNNNEDLRIRFSENNECKFIIDLDIETIEELIKELTMQISSFQIKGGTNV